MLEVRRVIERLMAERAASRRSSDQASAFRAVAAEFEAGKTYFVGLDHASADRGEPLGPRGGLGKRLSWMRTLAGCRVTAAS